MITIYLNKEKYIQIKANNDCAQIVKDVAKETGFNTKEFYLEQNGKLLQDFVQGDAPVYCRQRVLGGKGGFGSMLRAIGAQIEKTTNREACRDLSGRRLRDINEEKRLKAWLDKQAEREREAEEKKKRKIEKLLAVPKHEFKDEEYEAARSRLTEKVNDAVEKGLKKSTQLNNKLKRKAESTVADPAKLKKSRPTLWIDDISDDSDGSDASDASNEHETETTVNNTKSLITTSN